MKKFLLLVAMAFITLTAEAQLVRSSALTVIREELPPVELGWKHIVDGQIGTAGFDLLGGVHYIAAYRFTENLLAGVGIGVENIDDGIIRVYDARADIPVCTCVPLYLHGRYYFSTNRWSPYVGASLGFDFASKRAYLNEYWKGHEVEGENPMFASAFADINYGYIYRLGADAKNELSLYVGLKLIRQRCVYVSVLPRYDNNDSDVVSLDAEGFDSVVGFYFGTSFTF